MLSTDTGASMSNTHHTIRDPINSDDTTSSAPPVPVGTTDGLQDALYLKEAGCAAAVSIGDIHQGQFGDCFLLSPMGEIARQSVIQGNSSFLPSMIHQNADGTETVKLYQPAGSGFSPVYETVNNDFSPIAVNSGTAQDVVGSQKEIWPQVIEKAYAQMNSGDASIANGGYPNLAMQALTGEAATVSATASLTLTQLLSWASNSDMIVFSTSNGGTMLPGMVADHCYMFAGCSGIGANTKVLLANPWGFDNPAPMSIAQIASGASGIVETVVGHFSTGAGHAGP
jgi:hypothetical protein